MSKNELIIKIKIFGFVEYLFRVTVFVIMVVVGSEVLVVKFFVGTCVLCYDIVLLCFSVIN